MSVATRSFLTTGLALMGAGFVTAAQLTPPLRPAENRVVEVAVSLAAAVTNGQPCSGFNTEGCDIWATQTYTPIALDPTGSAANIAANIVNAVASIPRAFVDALNELSYALEVTGNWWVYSPTNVLGFDPADPPKMTALVDLLIPFKPLSNATGEQLSWWAKGNLPMDAGCTGTVGPACADANSILSKMFLAPIWKLNAGYQFPTIYNPVSDAEGAVGQEIEGSTGDEVAWSGAYVKLNPLDPAYAVINYLMADPATNTPKPVTGAEIMATLDRLGKAIALDFNPFVPMSYLLKGWPYTALTPLFKPFLPVLCPQCNPVDPGLPVDTTPESAATTTLVSAAAAVSVPSGTTGTEIAQAPTESTGPTAPVTTAVAASNQTADTGDAKAAAEPVAATTRTGRAATRAAAEVPEPVAPAAAASESPETSAAETAAADDLSDVVKSASDAATTAATDTAKAASETVRNTRRGHQGPSSRAAGNTEDGGSAAKSRTRAAASSE